MAFTWRFVLSVCLPMVAALLVTGLISASFPAIASILSGPLKDRSVQMLTYQLVALHKELQAMHEQISTGSIGHAMRFYDANLFGVEEVLHTLVDTITIAQQAAAGESSSPTFGLVLCAILLSWVSDST